LNRKEYNIAVNDHSGKLYGYCLKYLRSQADASDIVQDSFEKLWKNRKKVEFNKSKAWLFTTAHNTLLNFITKKNRITYLPEMSTNETSSNHADDFEIREMVNSCLATLPPLQKSILLLRDLEGYNYFEIGEMLKLSESQVKVYLFRARNKVKNQITKINAADYAMHA
jgi:RNA polymerase sigma factor (sigma-70 family)